MSTRDLEREIWMEAKKVFCNSRLRLNDILEWSTSRKVVEVNAQEGEVTAKVLSFWVCIAKSNDKRGGFV